MQLYIKAGCVQSSRVSGCFFFLTARSDTTGLRVGALCLACLQSMTPLVFNSCLFEKAGLWPGCLLLCVWFSINIITVREGGVTLLCL